jgi:hypothetical protein
MGGFGYVRAMEEGLHHRFPVDYPRLSYHNIQLYALFDD